MLRFNRNFVVVSHYTRTMLKKLTKTNNVIVSYNGFTNQKLTRCDKLFDFLFVTSGEKHKRDYKTIIAILNKYKNIKIAICTSNDLLKQKFNNYDNITFFSNLNENELINLYSISKTYVNNSKIEGFGMPIIEALYCGCSLLLSKIPVYIEILSYYEEINNRVYYIKNMRDSIIIPNINLNMKNKPLKIVEQFNWACIYNKLVADLGHKI